MLYMISYVKLSFWNHYRYGFLKPVRVSKRIISHKYVSEIKVRILKKGFPANILMLIFKFIHYII